MIPINEKLIKLAQKHGAALSQHMPSMLLIVDGDVLCSLLQAVHDAAIERAADACLVFQNEWHELADVDAGRINFAGRCEDAIRNLKGTLPEMEG